MTPSIPAAMQWIEQRARAILETVPDYVWDGESLPVPVEDIVDSVFGLHVVDVDDLTSAPGCPPLEEGQVLSGLLLADRREIWCNASEGVQWPPRRRFTIAHELGHWVLHAPGQDSLFCRRATVAPEDSASKNGKDKRPPLPPAEEEANAFAAELLIPAHLLRYHYRNTTRDFQELCAMFGASQAAMGRRLRAVI